MGYKEEWLGACFGTLSTESRRINVYFKDGRDPAPYTMAVFDELKKEKLVWYIIDDETGEVLFDNDEGE